MQRDEKPDSWVGLKKCGCCVAVVLDDPEYKRDTEKAKREFLKHGLSVVHATWQEWQEKYMPSMGVKCTHDQPLAGTNDLSEASTGDRRGVAPE